MNPRFLKPSDAERALTEEVHYLHGLWRSGPPPNRKRNASPNRDAALAYPGPAASRQPNLENRWESETPQLRGCGEGQNPIRSGESTPGHRGRGDAKIDRAWIRPCPEQEPEPCRWGIFKPSPGAESSRPPLPLSLSAEEQVECDAATALRGAMRASKNYFAQKVKAREDEDDSSADDCSASDNVDEGEVKEDDAQTRAFKFFIGLFEEDEVLREYYEKKSEKGAFACLACAELGVRTTKPYKDCNSLLQHAFSIRKTKRQIEHRAFARAVCRVLGYNSSRLPSLVLDRGDTLGQALAKARGAELDVQKEDATGND